MAVVRLSVTADDRVFCVEAQRRDPSVMPMSACTVLLTDGTNLS